MVAANVNFMIHNIKLRFDVIRFADFELNQFLP